MNGDGQIQYSEFARAIVDGNMGQQDETEMFLSAQQGQEQGGLRSPTSTPPAPPPIMDMERNPHATRLARALSLCG
jgi:hypothetical protein